MEDYQKYIDEINSDIEKVTKAWRGKIAKDYGQHYQDIIEALFNVLSRGGKRIRGLLALRSYEAFGGQDKKAALRLATIIELVHAYLLVLDDIQDRSLLRRGQPAAHKLLETYHTNNHLVGNAIHFGISQTINAACFGSNLANILLSDLPVSAETRFNLFDMLSRYILDTTLGQIGDTNNEAFRTESEADIFRVLDLKTARYTFCMPFYLGATLAGAEVEGKFDEYLVNAGLAFQIHDDIIGTFGDPKQTGKPVLSDIREGKRTLLIVRSLEKASPVQKTLILSALGNEHLTVALFETVRDVIEEIGTPAALEKDIKALTEKAVSFILRSKLPPQDQKFFANIAQKASGL
jgi:geranylgeranyl diphosphate synthase type I